MEGAKVYHWVRRIRQRGGHRGGGNLGKRVPREKMHCFEGEDGGKFGFWRAMGTGGGFGWCWVGGAKAFWIRSGSAEMLRFGLVFW